LGDGVLREASGAVSGVVGVIARARIRAPGGCASDAVDERTGVAIDDDSAGDDGVAAAATPRPNGARWTRGCGGCGCGVGASSFSDFSAFSDFAVGKGGLPREMNMRASSGRVGALVVAMDVIGLMGFGAAVGCALALGVCAGPLVRSALDASAQIDATAVTRPPRPPRADLTLYFISI
jgi:hypothetical protein